MALQLINTGSGPNDGTGDPLRTAFTKINANFQEVYSKSAAGSNLDISDNKIIATNADGNVELEALGNGHVVINDDHFVLVNPRAPATPVGAAGDVKGMICWSANYFYVCHTDFDGVNNIWNRVLLSAW